MTDNITYHLTLCEVGEPCDFHGQEVTVDGRHFRVYEYLNLCEHHKYIHQHEQYKRKADAESKKALIYERLKRELQEHQWHNPPYKPPPPLRQKSNSFEGRCWDWIVLHKGYHYVRDKEYFESYTTLDNTRAIGTEILGIGSVKLEVLINGPSCWIDEPSRGTQTLILRDVLHIPAACNNGFVANLECERTAISEFYDSKKVLQGYDKNGNIMFSAASINDNSVDGVHIRWGLCLPNDLEGSPLAAITTVHHRLNIDPATTRWNSTSGVDHVKSEDEETMLANDGLKAIKQQVGFQYSKENIDATREFLKRRIVLWEEDNLEDMQPAAKRPRRQGRDTSKKLKAIKHSMGMIEVMEVLR